MVKLIDWPAKDFFEGSRAGAVTTGALADEADEADDEELESPPPPQAASSSVTGSVVLQIGFRMPTILWAQGMAGNDGLSERLVGGTDAPVGAP